MEKKTLIALLLVLGLGGLAGFLWWRQHKEETSPKEKPHPLMKLHASDIAALEMTQPGGKDKASLKRKGEAWQLVTPMVKPAETALVQQAIENLEKMTWEEVISDNSSQFDKLDISDDKATQVVAKDATDKILAHLYLGKSIGTGAMVRIAGQNQVWQVAQFSPYVFKKTAKEWRNHVIVDVKADDVSQLAIYRGGPTPSASVVVERVETTSKGKQESPSQESVWKVKESAEASWKQLSPDKLDQALINQLVNTLVSLRAVDFADDITTQSAVDEVGVGLPSAKTLQLYITLKNGNGFHLYLGAPKGEQRYARLGEKSPKEQQIYLISGWNAESLWHPPKDILDKTIVALPEEELQAITVQQDAEKLVLTAKDKTWKAEGLPEADEGKMHAFTNAFRSVKGQGFVELPNSIEGELEKTKTMITLLPKKGAPVVLAFAKLPGENMAIRRNKGEVWWIKKYQADALLKKAADFKKSPAPQGPPPGMRGMPMQMPMPMEE